MKQPIELRFNYPLLEDQESAFRSALTTAIGLSDTLVSLAPAGGRLKDREMVAAWLSGEGYSVNPGDVYAGGGGHHSCFTALLAAGLPNKTIAVEEYTYSNFKSMARLLHITLVPCLIDGSGLVPGSLKEVCKNNMIDALYIQPTLNNPVGTVMPLERRNEIVSIAREHELVIIEDDAYGFLEETFIPNFYHLAPERSFYVYSFSKPLAQGIKTSYLLAPSIYGPKVIDALRLTGTNPSLLFSNALNTMMENGTLKKLIRAKQEEGFVRQQQMKHLLEGYQFSAHKNGWHLWLLLPDHVKSSRLDQMLIQKDVLIMPSVSFSVSDNPFEGAIRIALGGEKDFKRVQEGIEIVREQIMIY